MAFKVGNFGGAGAIDAKKAAMEAAKAKALGSGNESEAAIVKWISPADCPDRNRIVFDDSGSMGLQLKNAQLGVVEYLKNCLPNQTAVAVHFMNTVWSTDLRSDLPTLGFQIENGHLTSGGTPFFNTCKQALEATPRLTRLIAFTDGAPTDQLRAEEEEAALQTDDWSGNSWIASANVIIKIAKSFAKPIPIDTVYFGEQSSYTQKNIDLLKYLSDQTGGYFLHFDPAKVSFRTAFKYLAPTKRLMLSSGSFRAALERGEIS